MRLFHFDPAAGSSIERFGSAHVVFSPVARPEGFSQVGCMHVGAGGLVGAHQAGMPQLFLVVAGEGWVRGEAPDRVPIGSGQAAFWERGEWHEAGSAGGMMVIVLEADTLDPAQVMPEVDA